MRTEHDTMGAVEVPDNAYYGAQTQRAVENFPISGRPLPPELIHALGLVKWACAKANEELGMFAKLAKPLVVQQIQAIQTAAMEVAEGKFDDHFPVDVFQTGSGTSTNMNANEVIARRANELLATHNSQLATPIHPNDHVNMGQSTNDIFPTAIHIAVYQLIDKRLLPAIGKAARVLSDKSEEWENILKIGRTHLADATPMTLGQEFKGLYGQLSGKFQTAWQGSNFLENLPVGGTAVGTGINTHPKFGESVIRCLFEYYDILGDGDGQEVFKTLNHFASNAQRDELVAAHSSIKSVAVTIMNVANNIRWLGSGPRCGFYEIIIPDLQPGSSIMPGKVNPVLCEALMQVCAKVIGNDATMTTCGMVGGQFQLNVMMPVMADVAIESVKILSNALEVFTEKCLKGLEANEEKCKENVEKSLMLATGLAPLIGYEKAAAIAKEAFKTGKTVREVCLEQNILPPEQLAEVLDPMKMTRNG
ncbi:fumarate hydratase class II [Planctomycetales bacterium]|nr:fumarate hydratase class II [Planctomycetales bacterium]